MAKSITVFNPRVMFKFNKTFCGFKGIKWSDNDHTRGTVQPRNSKGHFEKKVLVKVIWDNDLTVKINNIKNPRRIKNEY